MRGGGHSGDCNFKLEVMLGTARKRVPSHAFILALMIVSFGSLLLLAQHAAFHWQSRWNRRAALTMKAKLPGSYMGGEGIICDRSHPRTDICTAFGHVQMPKNSSLFLLNALYESNSGIEEKIRPYTRKWEKDIMDGIHEVTLRSVMFPSTSHLKCDVVHNVPAIVFSTGGYTGNLYHEFNDGIIPLYITSQHLEKEVVFVIADCRNWWLTKYGEVINQLTQYSVINFENETMVHCFPEVTLGLFIHGELMIDSTLMFDGKSLFEFRAFLNHAYTPHWRLPDKSDEADDKPNLVILVRESTRLILNLEEVVELAEQIGFNVTLWKPLRTTELKRTYRLLNSSHVLLGVHGAALTHFLFMCPGSVFIQVIPLGTDWAADNYYGSPAQRMGLQYIGYNVDIEESTLSQKYDRDDIILTNPKAVVKQGWSVTKQIYLESQDVMINLSRMRSVLIDAKKKVKKSTSSVGDVFG